MRVLGLATSFALMVGGLLACTGDKGEQGPPGETGGNGAGALARTSPEPAGANCPTGGIKIETGLDAGEVTSTSYVCNGSGASSLVRTSTEPAGANCPYGGTKIETGLDANHD